MLNNAEYIESVIFVPDAVLKLLQVLALIQQYLQILLDDTILVGQTLDGFLVGRRLLAFLEVILLELEEVKVFQRLPLCRCRLKQ